MTENCLYVLRHTSSRLIKIGVTGNWKSRANQLCVGSKCQALIVVACENNYYEEDRLHREYDKERVPQTEWFCLNERQITTLIKSVSQIGNKIAWELEDVKPKLKRKPKKPKLLFTDEQLDHWEKRLIKLPFVSLVDVYRDAVVFYGLELWRRWGNVDLQVVGSIGYKAEGVIFEYGFESNLYGGIKPSHKFKDEERFFESLTAAAALAYEDGASRLLMKHGTKIKRPTGIALDWFRNVDLEQYLPKAPRPGAARL